MSLFACSAADVTLERVRELVGQDLPESLTLEYKEKHSSSLVESVAAMANTYGGLILVGELTLPALLRSWQDSQHPHAGWLADIVCRRCPRRVGGATRRKDRTRNEPGCGGPRSEAGRCRPGKCRPAN
jgi:hypothetical protein